MSDNISRRRALGRPVGSQGKKTKNLENSIIRSRVVAERLIGSLAFEGDALAYLCTIYKDPEQTQEVRIDAAKAALPYERPRLAAIAAKVEAAVTYESLIQQSIIEYDKMKAEASAQKAIEGLAYEVLDR